MYYEVSTSELVLFERHFGFLDYIGLIFSKARGSRLKAENLNKEETTHSMEKEKFLENVDEIRLMQKRFELVTLARYRDKSRMKKAIEVQDELREKSKRIKWNSTKELRKWRNSIYGSSCS